MRIKKKKIIFPFGFVKNLTKRNEKKKEIHQNNKFDEENLSDQMNTMKKEFRTKSLISYLNQLRE